MCSLILSIRYYNSGKIVIIYGVINFFVTYTTCTLVSFCKVLYTFMCSVILSIHYYNSGKIVIYRVVYLLQLTFFYNGYVIFEQCDICFSIMLLLLVILPFLT